MELWIYNRCVKLSVVGEILPKKFGDTFLLHSVKAVTCCAVQSPQGLKVGGASTRAWRTHSRI